MRTLWLVQASFPAWSRMLAIRYSRTAVRNTGVAELRWLVNWLRRRRSTWLTGNCSPALVERERECLLLRRRFQGCLPGDMVSAGCCLYQLRLMIPLAGASWDASVSLLAVSPCSGLLLLRELPLWQLRLCDVISSQLALTRTGLEMADRKSGLSVEKTISWREVLTFCQTTTF